MVTSFLFIGPVGGGSLWSTRETVNFGGLYASIFVIFFCNTPRILRGVYGVYAAYDGVCDSAYEYGEASRRQLAHKK